MEAELFGYVRGAFSGAVHQYDGQLMAAQGGTVFLDEIGSLRLDLQTKLLRVLQEREVVRVGESRARSIDVRVIAATNRSLVREVSEGRFREDLFYRLAVLVLTLPPLRDRAGDLGPLIDRLLAQVNEESRGEPGFEPKTLTAAARNALQGYAWPGNVRELQNTLRRAAVWSDGNAIAVEDVRAAILPAPARVGGDGILGRPLGDGFSIEQVLEQVARHYLQRALQEAGGNKTHAAELVKLASYQTFTNWTKRYGVEG
jgi:transcriptional regulator with PAS, ATPase and Fis domain